jgi:hypothetical protein
MRLFQAFLDAAVSEQIARMVAMKAATEAADEMIKRPDPEYNRARRPRSPWSCSTSSAAPTRSPEVRESRERLKQCMTTDTGTNYGTVTQVIGSTLDAQFAEERMPAIYNALKVEVERTVLGETTTETLWCEVAQHLGGGRCAPSRSGSTDGLQRGSEDRDTGAPVTVPVGEETLGRVFNLVGEPIDGRGPVTTEERRPIHREPPELDELTPKTEIFETGIKVIDLLCPLVRGGKAGLFGGAGVGKTVIIQELIARSPASTPATPASPASASAPARATTSGSRCRRPRSATPARASSTRR